MDRSVTEEGKRPWVGGKSRVVEHGGGHVPERPPQALDLAQEPVRVGGAVVDGDIQLMTHLLSGTAQVFSGLVGSDTHVNGRVWVVFLVCAANVHEHAFENMRKFGLRCHYTYPRLGSELVYNAYEVEFA